MLKSIQQRDLDRNRWIKITMTVILVVICLSMVVTLIPGLMNTSATTSPGRRRDGRRHGHQRRSTCSAS